MEVNLERLIPIGVVGAGDCNEEVYRTARRVGELIARKGGLVICGGLGGVMEAAARGAKEGGGLTVGILPGTNVGDANPYIDIPIVTGMGHARNVIIVRSCRAIIAISGGYGTLSEVAIALKIGIPVIALNSWRISDDVILAESPDQAVSLAFQEGGK